MDNEPKTPIFTSLNFKEVSPLWVDLFDEFDNRNTLSSVLSYPGSKGTLENILTSIERSECAKLTGEDNKSEIENTVNGIKAKVIALYQLVTTALVFDVLLEMKENEKLQIKESLQEVEQKTDDETQGSDNIQLKKGYQPIIELEETKIDTDNMEEVVFDENKGVLTLTQEQLEKNLLKGLGNGIADAKKAYTTKKIDPALLKYISPQSHLKLADIGSLGKVIVKGNNEHIYFLPDFSSLEKNAQMLIRTYSDFNESARKALAAALSKRLKDRKYQDIAKVFKEKIEEINDKSYPETIHKKSKNSFADRLSDNYWARYADRLPGSLLEFISLIGERKRQWSWGRIITFMPFALLFAALCAITVLESVKVGLLAFAFSLPGCILIGATVASCTFLCNLAFGDRLYNAVFTAKEVGRWFRGELSANFNSITKDQNGKRLTKGLGIDGWALFKTIVALPVLLLTILACAAAIAFAFHFITYGNAIGVFHFAGANIVGHALGVLCGVIMVFVTIKDLLLIAQDEKEIPVISALSPDKEKKRKGLLSEKKRSLVLGLLVGFAVYTPFLGYTFAFSMPFIAQFLAPLALLTFSLIFIAWNWKKELLSLQTWKSILADAVKGIILVLTWAGVWEMSHAAVPYFLASFNPLVASAVASSPYFMPLMLGMHIFFFLGNFFFTKSIADNAFKWLSAPLFSDTLFSLIDTVTQFVFVDGKWGMGDSLPLVILRIFLKLIVFPGLFVPFLLLWTGVYIVDTICFTLFHGAAHNADFINFTRWSAGIKRFALAINELSKASKKLWFYHYIGYFLLTLIKLARHIIAGVFSVVLFADWCPIKLIRLAASSIYGKDNIKDMVEAPFLSGSSWKSFIQNSLTYLWNAVCFFLRMIPAFACGLILLPFSLLWNCVYGFLIKFRVFFNASGNAAILALVAIMAGSPILVVGINFFGGVLLSVGAMGANVLFVSLFSSFILRSFKSPKVGEFGHRRTMKGLETLSELITNMCASGGWSCGKIWRILKRVAIRVAIKCRVFFRTLTFGGIEGIRLRMKKEKELLDDSEKSKSLPGCQPTKIDQGLLLSGKGKHDDEKELDGWSWVLPAALYPDDPDQDEVAPKARGV